MSASGLPEILALIPARGGSKGIPRKNLMEVAGRPLIVHSILQAQQSRWIGRVVVTTDDPEIAEVARQHGAEAPFLRPAELAGDLSPDIDAFRHALDWLRRHEGYQPELVVHLRPTGPVRRVPVIDQAIARMREHPDADALRSVAGALQTPYKMWHLGEGGMLAPVLRIDGVADCQSQPRQQLPAVYWQNGYVDIVRPRAILEQDSMWGTHVLGFVVDEPMLEIDYPDDLPAVEEALRRLEQGLPLSTAARRGRHAV